MTRFTINNIEKINCEILERFKGQYQYKCEIHTNKPTITTPPITNLTTSHISFSSLMPIQPYIFNIGPKTLFLEFRKITENIQCDYDDTTTSSVLFCKRIDITKEIEESKW